MSKILIVSDSPVLKTGLARVGRELGYRFLKNHYQVAFLGWHHTNLPHNLPFTIYPTLRGSQNEPAWFKTAVENFKPDILLCIGDFWYFSYIEEVLKQSKYIPQERWLYLTLDGEPFYPEWIKYLKIFTRIYTQSFYALSVIKQTYPEIKGKAVWCGVDKKVFYQLDKKPIWRDKFVVMINAYNCDRKNLPASIEGFYLFSRDKQDVLLFLNTQPKTEEGRDLPQLIHYFNIYNKCMFEKSKNKIGGIDDKTLNAYYNSSDVLLCTSGGEGFNLTILEAFRTKTLVLHTNFTTADELLGNNERGIKLPVSAYFYGAFNLKKAIVKPEIVAEKLQIVYEDWGEDKSLINTLTEKAYRFSNNLTWDRTYNEIISYKTNKEFENV